MKTLISNIEDKLSFHNKNSLDVLWISNGSEFTSWNEFYEKNLDCKIKIDDQNFYELLFVGHFWTMFISKNGKTESFQYHEAKY